MVGSVKLSISEGIGVAEFFHPKGNSLPKILLEKLASTIEEAGKNDLIKVIILKSSGEGAFCAGASFDELAEIKSFQEGTAFFSGFAKVILAMKNCPKFILSRVQGKAVGGGVGIIAASDYAFATEQASIKLSELNLGIAPFVIAPVVERKIGVSSLSTLSINASEWRSSRWAEQKGLYNQVFENQDELDVELEKLANRLSKTSPEAMKELKTVLWKGIDQLEETLEERAKLSGKLALSSFTKHFIKDFKSKK